MQRLHEHVNTQRDRRPWLRGGGYPTGAAAAHDVGARGRLVCLIGALSVVGFRDHGALALTVVAIGLAVAAANRAEDPQNFGTLAQVPDMSMIEHCPGFF